MKNMPSFSRKLLIAGTAIAVTLSTPLGAMDKPPVIEPLDVEDVPATLPDDTYSAGPSAMNPFAGLENFALKKPIVELPKPDPARLAIANKVAAALYPDGTSARMFASIRTELVQPVLNRFWTMKESEFSELFGMPMPPSNSYDDDGNPTPRKDETLGEAMGKEDLHARERIDAFVKVYVDLMGEMASPLDGDWRGAMARDFARRYTTAQLNDMAAFFATPSGKTFGRDYWLSSFSLDIIQTSLMNWPKMMKAVPDFAERLKKADAHLPPAPKGSPFAAPDLSYLPTCAQDGDESDCTDADWAAWEATGAAAEAAGDAASAAAAAVDAAAAATDDYTEEQAKKRAAWSKKDRDAVEKAETELDAAYAKHRSTLNAAELKVDTAIEKAMKNAGQWTDPEDHHHHDGPDDEEK